MRSFAFKFSLFDVFFDHCATSRSGIQLFEKVGNGKKLLMRLVGKRMYCNGENEALVGL